MDPAAPPPRSQVRPELSITVLHYNRWDLTKDCLASIDAQEIPCSYEKLLCDNFSNVVPPLPEGWVYRCSATQRGNIGGQNFCFEQAQGQWVLFMANDVRLFPGCLLQLWGFKQMMEADRANIGQLQPVCSRSDKAAIDQAGMDWKWPGYGISRHVSMGTNIPIVPSTCYLMRKSVWKEMEGFDETLGSSHEDVDMGLRLARAGYQNFISHNALAIHLRNQTLKHTLSNHRQVFQQARIKVIKKHYRGLDRWARLAAVNLLNSLPRL